MENTEWYSSWRVRDSLPVQKIPEKEMWRVGLLNTLLGMKTEQFMMVHDQSDMQFVVKYLQVGK